MKPAVGKLTSEYGVMKHTPSIDSASHHTFWVIRDTNPWKVFKVINISTESVIES